jgi:hypothetical protein
MIGRIWTLGSSGLGYTACLVMELDMSTRLVWRVGLCWRSTRVEVDVPKGTSGVSYGMTGLSIALAFLTHTSPMLDHQHPD